MNDLEDKDIWLTVSELASLELETLPSTRANVQKWATKKGWEKRARKGSGGGFFYSFASLPEDVKLEIKQRKWEEVCKISKNRRFYKVKEIKRELNSSKKEESTFNTEEKSAVIECIQRLVVEEYRLGYKREEIAAKLGMHLKEFAKYELAEKPLNTLHLQKLSELGFDVWFILFGEKATTDKHIHNELNYNQGNVNIKN